MHQQLRCHLHQLDPTFEVPLRMLARSSHLERVSRWLARQDQELQVRLARELVTHCRALNRTISALDQELEQRTAQLAPAPLETHAHASLVDRSELDYVELLVRDRTVHTSALP